MLHDQNQGLSTNAALYDPDRPDVSIVILNLNRPDMTIACLESLWKHTTGARYEVIVVDNGSHLPAYEQLAAYCGPHRLIRLNINRFFGEGNNIGAEHARGEYLVFLNNDIIVKRGWLAPLLEVFQTHPDAGCSGPKFIYPSGELQEAGALLDEDGASIQIGKFQSPDQSRFNRLRIVDYVSAAAVLMRKSDFYAVLGFDFRYEPAYYEDCDLCLKIATLGRKTYYVPQSEVIHHERQTTTDPSHGLKLDTVVDLNREKFIKRWKPFLQTGHHGDRSFASRLVPARPTTARRTAGFFTPYNIIPGGSERYLLSVMEVFASQGYVLTLIVPERFSRLRISSVLDSLDLDLPGLDIVTYAEAEKGEGYDLFFCLGGEICPISQGLGKRNIYCCQFPFRCDPAELRRRLPWLENYDTIVCYSEFVEGFIRQKLEGTDYQNIDVQVIYPPVGLEVEGAQAEKSGILAIGRFFTGGHCKRQDMMIETVRDLIDHGIEIELHLVGSLHPEPEHREYANKCRARARGLPVVFHIDAPPEDLADLLRRSSVYWHGAGLGVNPMAKPEQCEHFGISVVEAMSARLIPFVVNNGGPSSIVQDGLSGFHYASRTELVEQTAWLLGAGEAEQERLRDNAFSRAQTYSYAAFRKRWAALLQDLCAEEVILA
jgi:GT2 family glycosyltransferase/glycosyltransferase involved in cell wall biosynthesis